MKYKNIPTITPASLWTNSQQDEDVDKEVRTAVFSYYKYLDIMEPNFEMHFDMLQSFWDVNGSFYKAQFDYFKKSYTEFLAQVNTTNSNNTSNVTQSGANKSTTDSSGKSTGTSNNTSKNHSEAVGSNTSHSEHVDSNQSDTTTDSSNITDNTSKTTNNVGQRVTSAKAGNSKSTTSTGPVTDTSNTENSATDSLTNTSELGYNLGGGNAGGGQTNDETGQLSSSVRTTGKPTNVSVTNNHGAVETSVSNEGPNSTSTQEAATDVSDTEGNNKTTSKGTSGTKGSVTGSGESTGSNNQTNDGTSSSDTESSNTDTRQSTTDASNNSTSESTGEGTVVSKSTGINASDAQLYAEYLAKRRNLTREIVRALRSHYRSVYLVEGDNLI